MKMIAKRFSSSSVGVLLEKVIRKNHGMFRHETSLRKPFFSKAICSSSKKIFLHIVFAWKFRKMSRKKTLRKISRACFDEYFCKFFLKVDKTYLQISFEISFSKCSEQMYYVKSSGRYFLFCPHLIRETIVV